MSNQLQITGGAKVRSLEGVITGTSGVLSSVPLGGANGVATLDSGGKVPVSQLPSSVVTYLGTWDAATNTPTLTNGTGDAGDMYICNVAGTVNFGAGPITFSVGDWVLYGSGTWQKSNGQNGTVTSVAVSNSGDALSITGSPIVTAGTINIGFAGTGSQYIKGDGTLATFPTTIDQAKRLITEVYNSTGATLSKGTVVYINGGQGNLPTVTKAQANADNTSAQTYGVVQSDITNMNNGYVVVIGSLTDIDTQAYAVGTQLYLSGTTAGDWTSTKPSAPIHLVYVGIVVRSHPTQGVVEIRIQNGYELEELHDVAISAPVNNQGIFYNSSNNLWENKSIATVLGYTPANAATTLTINGTTYDISANRTWNVGTVTGSGSADQVAYWNSASGLTYDSTFYYSASNKRLGVNTNTPNATIGANCGTDSGYGLLVKNADNNYNGLGIAITSNYGNVIATEKLGTASAKNLTLINQVGYLSLTEAGNLGLNILTPTPSPSGVGSTGFDVFGGSNAASIGFHNTASGVGNTNGAYIYLTNTLGFTLRNLEGSIVSSSLGDFSVITNSTENFRVNASTGSIWQSNITNALLKANSSNVIVAAVANTDYQSPITLNTSGSSGAATFTSNVLNIPNYTLSGLGGVPTSRTLTINGTAYDLSADRSWSVGTLTGGGADGRVAFWNGASNVVSDSLFVWDDTNNRLGIGLVNPQRALEIYSASADTHLRLSGAAPSVSMGEAITGSIYQAKFGLATANNQFVTGSVAGDFVINNQTGSTIWAYNSTEKMRLDTSGNLGVGGTARSGYRLHVYDTAPMLGIESTTTGNVYLRMLQSGTVVSGAYYNNSDTSFRIFNNNGGLRFDTSTVNGAITVLSAGNVGIGATSTSYKLSVVGGNGDQLLLDNTGQRYTQISFNNNGILKSSIYWDNNNSLLTFSSAATFSSSVTVSNGDSKFYSSGTSLWWGANGATDYGQLNWNTGEAIIAATTGNQLTFRTNGVTSATNRMVITSSGNIGIGTSSMSYAKFNVYNNTNDATYGAKIQGVFGPADYQDSDATQNYGSGTSETQFLAGNTSRPAMISLGGNVNTGEAIGVINFFRSSNTDTYRSRAWISSGLNTTGTANQHGGFLAFSTAADGETNPQERMRITSGGNVLMNTTTGSTSGGFTNTTLLVKQVADGGAGGGIQIQANGSDNVAFFGFDGNVFKIGTSYRATGSYQPITFSTGGDTSMTIVTDGSIQMPRTPTTANAANMYMTVAGTIYRSTSSLKYKNSVTDYDKGLDIVNQLRPVYYKGNNDGDTMFAGLIAEEVHDLGLTEFVQYADDGTPDALAYQNMIALAFKAIQELSAKVTELENKLK